MKQVKNVANIERDTDEHAAINPSGKSALYKTAFGWEQSPQARELQTYIETEAPGLLKIGYPIVANDALIVGYTCEASIQHHGKNTINIPLHSVEQARIAVDELIRSRVKLLIADLL